MGHECGFELCAWSRHIVPFLRRARPRWNVSVVNVAQGGWGSQQFADIPGVWSKAAGADIFIVDTSVNARESRDTASDLDRLMWRLLHEHGTHASPLPPAVLYVQVPSHRNVSRHSLLRPPYPRPSADIRDLLQEPRGLPE